jgi:ABC-type transport system involved in multi-copper enzyme maturation permease subunit
VHFRLSDLETVKEPRPGQPQTGDYRFTLTVENRNEFYEAVDAWSRPADPNAEPRGRRARRAAAEEKADEKKAPEVPASLVEEFIKSQFAQAGNLEVASVTDASVGGGPGLRLRVETRGTSAVRGWLHDPCLFFGAVPLRFLRSSLGGTVYLIQDVLVNNIGAWVCVLLGVVITAFFIPNMLRKGTVDLLLVKPVHRTTLLIYKYVGGLTFMFLNSLLAVGGVWLVLGLRSGIWATGFLLTIFVLTFYFAILYAVSTLFGVLTRSAVVAILVTCFVWFALWIVGQAYVGLGMMKKEPAVRAELPEWVFTTVDTVHYVLPRTGDLKLLTTRLLSEQVLTEGEIRQARLGRAPVISWGESLTVSGVFITLMLGLACLRFATKDY